MTEDQLEQEALGWLNDVGYTSVYGPEIAVDGTAPERSNYIQVVLAERLRQAIHRLNPLVPLAAREDAQHCSTPAAPPATLRFDGVHAYPRLNAGSFSQT